MATVLVVDDEAAIRDLVRLNLELDGHLVVTAGDGAACLDAVRRTHPDLIFLDVMMPGLDGWQVLGRLKSDSDPDLSSIPVVMLTARTGDLDRIRGGIEGAVRYITKPFSADDLRAELDEALDGSPEPVKRKAAQHAALEHPAPRERGEGAKAPSWPRPRPPRSESAAAPPPPPPKPPRPVSPALAPLSAKQVELLTGVAATATVRQAAE